uniref:Lipocalin-like domain-containing protein n=2 Tax=unclassified Prevotella TaxID=2638335 RepID=A0AB33IW25_9BACT
MKRIMIVMLLFVSMACSAQSQIQLDSLIQTYNTTWHLYKSPSTSLFFSLNTCTGELKQVSLGTTLSSRRGITVINARPLVPAEAQYKGRFALVFHPSSHAFVLFDTEDGRAWEISSRKTFSLDYHYQMSPLSESE